MRNALIWVITQRLVVIPYRRFETNYRSHRQGQEWIPRIFQSVGGMKLSPLYVMICDSELGALMQIFQHVTVTNDRAK
jgi:hypothetical protein